jgi:cell division protein FtsB
MERLKQFISRIRLVYRPSSLLLKCIVAAMLVIATVALLALRGGISDLHQSTDAMRKEAAALESQNQQLQEDMGLQNTVAGILKIAKEKLGLVDPDSVIFDPAED